MKGVDTRATEEEVSVTLPTIRGRVHRVGDHVNTDLIIPGKYCLTTSRERLGPHCLEGWEPGFARRIRPGDVLVAGENFGGGSSREHAVLALQGAGIHAVIARSFARIFFRNAINLGLPVLVCPEAAVRATDGDPVEIDVGQGRILLRDQAFRAEPYPPFLQEILAHGGLMPYVVARLRADKAPSGS